MLANASIQEATRPVRKGRCLNGAPPHQRGRVTLWILAFARMTKAPHSRAIFPRASNSAMTRSASASELASAVFSVSSGLSGAS